MGAPTTKSKPSKLGVPVAKFPHKRLSAKSGNPADQFVLCDPASTTDDFQEDCLEKSPKMTVLGGFCTNASDFDDQKLQVHSICWAIPHLLKVSEESLLDDPRGALVMLKESQLSFRNVSMNEVIIHANTPVARLDNPDAIYARASGFRKGGTITDDVILKPGETLTYSVPWEKMQSNVPLTTVKDMRLWMNMITFCVEMKNVSSLTGSVIPENAEVVTIIPKTRYWKRKSNPIPPDADSGVTLDFQDDENFGFQTLGGIEDLYKVQPVDAMGSTPPASGLDGRYVRDKVLFSANPGRVVLCQDAYAEGDLLGIAGLNIGDYTTAALKIRNRFGSVYEFLKMKSRVAENVRLVVQGLTVASDERDPTFSYSYFKFVKEYADEGAWVLWDEDRKQPRSADPKMGIETVMSSFVPIMVIEGLQHLHPDRFKGYSNVHGQPYGDPQPFAEGEFITKAISVISVISRVAVFALGLL
jgi:hypothetical protein